LGLLAGVLVVLVVLLAAAVAALLVQRATYARSQAELRASEERFRQLTEHAPVMIWTSRPDTSMDYFNRRCLDFTGLPMEGLLGTGWLDAVHPDDVQKCRAVYMPAFEHRSAFQMEYRIRSAAGTYKWVLDLGVPNYDAVGGFTGYIGTTIDITDRRNSEDALRESEAILQSSTRRIHDLAGRLIVSQESERARVARDLHDDLSQQLAGLSIALSSLKRRASTTEGASRIEDEIAVLQSRAFEAAEHVRLISHGLHPTALEHVGLVAALSSHCAELQRHRGLEVSFAATGSFAATNDETALCLYRVAQEALRNVVTHAGARRVEVRLLDEGDRIELTIADDGKGFHIVDARDRNRGLGLISMSERVKLVGGTVSVTTEINRGTTVHVHLARPVAA